MSENLKIRFRLPNGEEFEAEGPQDFIESQRADFLSLIGRGVVSKPCIVPTASAPVQPVISSTFSTIPAAVRAEAVPTNVSSAFQSTNPSTKNLLQTPSAAHLWERLLKKEGDLLILRRKSRLSASEAALLILAGAQHLLKADGYRAILLSKSLHESGFEAGRLDRLLADGIKESYISARGSKRSRSYRLTPAGFARAFVLAEKRVGEIV